MHASYLQNKIHPYQLDTSSYLHMYCFWVTRINNIFNRIVHPSCCTLSRNILAELPCQPLDTYTRYSNIVTFSCQHYMFVTFFHHRWKRMSETNWIQTDSNGTKQNTTAAIFSRSFISAKTKFYNRSTCVKLCVCIYMYFRKISLDTR